MTNKVGGSVIVKWIHSWNPNTAAATPPFKKPKFQYQYLGRALTYMDKEYIRDPKFGVVEASAVISDFTNPKDPRKRSSTAKVQWGE